jgi:hypothetical protein
MTWTPGPWTVYPDLDDCYPFAIGTDMTTHPSVTRRYIHAGVEGEANARLISLAPEMAESLEAVLGWLESTDEIVTNHGAHSDAVWARKLLARARGEA